MAILLYYKCSSSLLLLATFELEDDMTEKKSISISIWLVQVESSSLMVIIKVDFLQCSRIN